MNGVQQMRARVFFFYFVIYSGIPVSWGIFSFHLRVCHGWKWIYLNQYPILYWHFLIWYFLGVTLCDSRYIFTLAVSSGPNSFPMLLIHLFFSFMYLSFQYFAPKLVCFLTIRLLVCLCAFFYLQVYFCIDVEYPILCVSFYSTSIFFSLSSFSCIFRFISSMYNIFRIFFSCFSFFVPTFSSVLPWFYCFWLFS